MRRLRGGSARALGRLASGRAASSLPHNRRPRVGDGEEAAMTLSERVQRAGNALVEQERSDSELLQELRAGVQDN